ncbi:MAG TPA: NIPSNAP family protein [Chloroflexota bacterium]|jgi:class 3 adenylate cyclase|nr:NIPSNAP family protein [Chloroflexota bacterium]
MLHELRVYEVVPGRMPALHDRFATITSRLFAKHGIRVLGYWTDVIGSNDRLTYLVAWDSLSEREQRWTAFATDPEWIAARNKTEESGPIVARVTNTVMQPTPYSPPYQRS